MPSLDAESRDAVDKFALSIVIPVLNDAQCLGVLLEQLSGFHGETIVADGGSNDSTLNVAEEFGARVVEASAGRARQMNEGAKQAQGSVLLFLHADSILPAGFDDLIATTTSHHQFQWGRFDVRLSGRALMLRIVEWMMNNRSALTGICTGDQGIFVKSDRFKQAGGFPEIEIMEDIAFSKRMQRRPYRIQQPIVTSSRRWERNGIFRTIGLMWWLRLRYFFGANPNMLAQLYRHAR